MMKTLVSYIKSDNANTSSRKLLGDIVEYFRMSYINLENNETGMSKFMYYNSDDLFFPEDGLENYKGVELAIVWSRLVIKIAKAQKNKEAEELFNNFLKELEK